MLLVGLPLKYGIILCLANKCLNLQRLIWQILIIILSLSNSNLSLCNMKSVLPASSHYLTWKCCCSCLSSSACLVSQWRSCHQTLSITPHQMCRYTLSLMEVYMSSASYSGKLTDRGMFIYSLCSGMTAFLLIVATSRENPQAAPLLWRRDSAAYFGLCAGNSYLWWCCQPRMHWVVLLWTFQINIWPQRTDQTYWASPAPQLAAPLVPSPVVTLVPSPVVRNLRHTYYLLT